MSPLSFRDPSAARAGGSVLVLATILISLGLLFHPVPAGGFEERPSVLQNTPWWGPIHVAIAAGFVLCVLGTLLLLVAGGSLRALAIWCHLLALTAQRPTSNNMFPRWSHDGRHIVFTSDRDGDPEIYVMEADGSHPVRLTYAPGRDAHPSFSPDDRRIVFQSPRANGRDTNIYTMGVDGSHVVQLTNLKGFAGVPVYSPDGKSIVFQWRETSDFDDNTKWRIGVMDADGRNLHLITPGVANDQVPNWSRDGRRLIFYSDRTGKNQIYTMRADGGEVRRLVTTGFNDNAASWSPDERRIAFTSDRDGNSEIYVMDADGGHVRRLTHTRATERAAAWSPDGATLLFSSDGDGPSEVYVMPADGSHLVRLTE